MTKKREAQEPAEDEEDVHTCEAEREGRDRRRGSLARVTRDDDRDRDGTQPGQARAVPESPSRCLRHRRDGNGVAGQSPDAGYGPSFLPRTAQARATSAIEPSDAVGSRWRMRPRRAPRRSLVSDIA